MANLTLRRVVLDDSRLLFEWRNDSLTRAQSFNHQLLDWETHEAWLRNAIRDLSRTLVILEVDGVPVGTGRAVERGGGYELSWAIGASYRGQGYGTKLVTELAKRFTPCLASIKSTNTASVRVAERAGLQKVTEMPNVLVYGKWD